MHHITTEFELPDGYTDDSGTKHTSVTMRRVITEDIIVLQSDQRFMQAVKLGGLVPRSLLNQAAFDMTSMTDSIAHAPDSEVNVGQLHLANSISMLVNCLLLSRVITRLGSIEKPGYGIISKLYPSDVAVCMEAYNRLNTVANIKTEEHAVPFGRSEN